METNWKVQLGELHGKVRNAALKELEAVGIGIGTDIYIPENRCYGCLLRSSGCGDCGMAADTTIAMHKETVTGVNVEISEYGTHVVLICKGNRKHALTEFNIKFFLNQQDVHDNIARVLTEVEKAIKEKEGSNGETE